jgi:hypothetical protein
MIKYDPSAVRMRPRKRARQRTPTASVGQAFPRSSDAMTRRAGKPVQQAGAPRSTAAARICCAESLGSSTLLPIAPITVILAAVVGQEEADLDLDQPATERPGTEGSESERVKSGEGRCNGARGQGKGSRGRPRAPGVQTSAWGDARQAVANRGKRTGGGWFATGCRQLRTSESLHSPLVGRDDVLAACLRPPSRCLCVELGAQASFWQGPGGQN